MTSFDAVELLAQDFTPKTEEEWERQRETEYRRGYRDGWVQAIDVMYDLITGRRGRASQALQQAYDICFDHFEGALWAWMRGDCSRMILPPLPKRG